MEGGRGRETSTVAMAITQGGNDEPRNTGDKMQEGGGEEGE